MPTTNWIILRTGGQQTLKLAKSLVAAGIDAWTPTRTVKRPAPGQRKALVLGRRRVMIEVDVAILPSFVFARADRMGELIGVAAMPFSGHPSFTLLRIGERIPVIGNASIAGLQQAERDAGALIQAQRDADTREEAQRIRIAALKGEAAKRKATLAMERQRRNDLRATRPTLPVGATVNVQEFPALAGAEGVIVSYTGADAWVQIGNHAWKIDTWRLHPAGVCETHSDLDTAA